MKGYPPPPLPISREGQLFFLGSETERAKKEHNPYLVRMLLSIAESVKAAQEYDLKRAPQPVGTNQERAG